MKESLLGQVLVLVAKTSSESTSVFCFYEPKVPEVLKKNKKKRNKND